MKDFTFILTVIRANRQCLPWARDGSVCSTHVSVPIISKVPVTNTRLDQMLFLFFPMKILLFRFTFFSIVCFCQIYFLINTVSFTQAFSDFHSVE